MSIVGKLRFPETTKTSDRFTVILFFFLVFFISVFLFFLAVITEIDMSSDGEAEQPQENLNADSSVYLTPESHRSRDPMNV